MKFTVALLQISSFGNDQGKNLVRGVQACREAKVLGADLAVFPELWNIGATLAPFDPEGRRRWIAAAIDQKSIFFQTFASLAQELQMNITVTIWKHTPHCRGIRSPFSIAGARSYSTIPKCLSATSVKTNSKNQIPAGMPSAVMRIAAPVNRLVYVHSKALRGKSRSVP